MSLIDPLFSDNESFKGKKIVSTDAYKEYQDNIAEYHKLGDCYLSPSTGDSFDYPNGPFHLFYNKILHLPQEEQSEAIEIAKKRRSFYKKAYILLQNAFGIKRIATRTHALEERKSEIIEMFGKFYTMEEVHQKTFEWGFNISLVWLDEFRRRYGKEINDRQEVFRRDVSDMRLAYDRGRLEELTQLYKDRKELYDRSKGKEDYRLLLLTLRAIKDEIKGDKLTIDLGIELSVEESIQNQVNEQMLKGLNLLSFVVAKIAGKNGVDPSYYISRLENSFYSKFNMFGNVTDFEAEILYPSEQNYTIEEIKPLVLKKYEEGKKSHFIIEQPKPVDTKKSIKNKLKALLEEQQKNVDEKKKNL